MPLLRAARVDMSWATPQRAAAGRRLWFYDRRGLAEPLYEQPARRPRHINCAGLLPKKVASVFWRRDLSRILGVLLKEKGGLQFGRWKPDWLPAAPPEPTEETPVQPARGWVLDPVWMR